MSSNGRFVAFATDRALVEGDGNSTLDVYLRDRDADVDGILDETAVGDSTIRRISVSPLAAEPNGASRSPAISSNGRWVAFASSANNLVEGDGNARTDVFLVDTDDESIIRVSRRAGNASLNGNSDMPSISADGRFVAYRSAATNAISTDRDSRTDIYVFDRVAGSTRLASISSKKKKGNKPSTTPAISGDGKWVAFASAATNLVPRDGNKKSDVFLHQLSRKKTQRVSVNSKEAQAKGGSSSPTVSKTGRYIGFVSSAPNLVSGDTNRKTDVFVRDRSKGTTTRASVRGRTQAKGSSSAPSISSSGTVISYASSASNLVSGDTNGASDVFVTTVSSRSTKRVSLTSSGKQANGRSGSPAISADAGWIAFDSAATNLVVGATSPGYFARPRTTGSTRWLSEASLLPPDPEALAPQLPDDAPAPMDELVDFLYTGPDAIQIGVDPDTIEDERVSVMRGRVFGSDGRGLAGVKVEILDRPELGHTFTRTDGAYDLAVNGGGMMTLHFSKQDHMELQRTQDVPWQTFVNIEDVTLNRFDPRTTRILQSSTAPFQVARGSTMSDGDGSRTATLLFPDGVNATLHMPGGSTDTIADFTVRATEYTTGADGSESMPGELPATSAYTYAVEFSLDEAEADGAVDVTFDKSVISYTENFLGLPVGMSVPSAYYDQTMAAWVPSENGLVVKYLGVVGGNPAIDTDGNGTADGAARLAEVGITAAELARVAALYSAGKQLWRVPVKHFSPWDYNHPYGGPAGGGPPPPPGGGPPPPGGPPCQAGGSIIMCQTQGLAEEHPVTGTDINLRYSSEKVPGREANLTLEVPVSGSSVHPALEAIHLEVSIAGRQFTRVLPPTPNQTASIEWDGLDAYGRRVVGAQSASVRVGNEFKTVYYATPEEFQNSFGSFGDTELSASPTRDRLTYWVEAQMQVGAITDLRWQGLGGWTLDVLHQYDPAGGVLYLGDGTIRRGSGLTNSITTIAGSAPTSPAGGYAGDGGPAVAAKLSYVRGLAAGPDGTVFIADSGNGVVRKVDRDGTITTVAGGGTPDDGIGDGGQATDAELVAPHDLTVARDGTLYIADTGNNRIRRVSTTGVITTVAGGADAADGLGDGGLATEAELFRPRGIAIGEDGTLFIADTGNDRIRRVSPDGMITTSVGGGDLVSGIGDGGRATDAELSGPYDVAVDANGVLYITDSGHDRVRVVRPDGVIDTFAGNGQAGVAGDGGPALEASLGTPSGIDLAEDGSVVVSQRANHVVRQIDKGGTIFTVAGTGAAGFAGDGRLATEAKLETPLSVAQAPDGTIYIADAFNFRVRRIAPTLPGFESGDIALPSADGGEVYRFDRTGRHLDTRHPLTGEVVRSFAYDGENRLASMTDAYGNVTTIQRDAAGKPTAIVAPGGQTTALTVGSDGFLASIADPSGATTTMGYAPGGLLTSFVEPGNRVHSFGYDAGGRLISDTNPDGYVQTLSRSITDDSATVTITTSSGRSRLYETRNLGLMGVSYKVTDHNGETTETTPQPGGFQRITYPDGTRVDMATRADPRWGGLVRYPGAIRMMTPSGLTRTQTVEREVVLASESNPLSVVSVTDTFGKNGTPDGSQDYDAATRTWTLTDAQGRESVIELNVKGDPVSWRQDPAMAVATVTRDPQGRLTELNNGDGPITYGYDPKNRLTSVAIAGKTSSRSYNDKDLLTGFTTFGLDPVSYGYDAAGNRTQVVMPGSDAHGFTWSPNGRLTGYDPPGTGAFAYDVDAEGLLQSENLPSGALVDHGYDSAGRASSTSYGNVTITRTFDEMNRMLSANRAVAGDAAAGQTVTHTFDSDLRTSTTFAGVADGVFEYTYNDRFERTSTRFTHGGTAVQLDSTYGPSGLRTGFGPFTLARGGPAGAISGITGSGASIEYTDDDTGDLDAITHAVGTQKYAFDLTRDARNLVTAMSETVTGTTTEYVYGYDDDGQLTSVERDGLPAETYTYDENGNRTSRKYGTDPIESATYDSQDRILSQSGVSYTFDADGFLMSRGSDTFDYSATGELLAANVGGQDVTYAYDGLGRRIARTDASGTYRYFYGDPDDDGLVTATRSPSGVVTVYLYDEAGRLFAMNRGGTYFLIATDHLGTPHVVTSAAGTVVKTLEHDAFGRLLSDSDPSFDLPFGFAGGLADPATGLVRFGRRDYDPEAGRWTARDPLLFEGGQFNLYAYAMNSPTTYRDPAGLEVPGQGAVCALADGMKIPGPIPAGYGTVYGKALEGGVQAAHDIQNSDNYQAIDALEYELQYGYPPPDAPQCMGGGGGGGGDGGGGGGGGC